MRILESVVSSKNIDGTSHIAPLGVWSDDLQRPILAPFKPSTTHDNLIREKIAVINCVDDVRIFAGCIVKQYGWPMTPAKKLPLERLTHCLNYREVEIVDIEEDELRPKLHCEIRYEEMVAPFMGFNRAQSAVIELAILVSRLDQLETDKIANEIEYLKIAVEKNCWHF